MDRRRFLTVTGTAVLTMGLAGCSDDASDSSSGDANGGGGGGDTSSGDGNSGGGGKKLEILNDEFYEEDMSAGVRGTVQNKSDSEIAYVGVQAEFLDSEGTRVGEGLDNTTDLGAGQKWEFDAMYLDTEPDKIDDYKIEVSDSPF